MALHARHIVRYTARRALKGVLTIPQRTLTDTSISAKILSATVDTGIRRLTLNDPKTRNALSLEMLEGLEKELTACSHEKGLRVIILGANPPIFSSGHNLKELRSDNGLSFHSKVFATCTRVMKMVQDIQIPIIAEVRGHAAAAGCQLAASCDIVVASETAQFSTPGIKAGLFCSTPGVAVSRAVPRKVALDMLLTGEPIDAQAALRAGLASRVVPDDKLEEETMKVAHKICEYSGPVVAIGKTVFYSQIEADRNRAYKGAEKVMLENLRLYDCQEGISGFVEKRKPNWSHSTKTVH